jgi:hypothetical protein
MTLPKLRSDQHAQILGFAIIGFGVSFLIDLVVPLLRYLAAWNTAQDLLSDKSLAGYGAANATKALSQFSADLALPTVVYGFVMFGMCGLTGLVIKSEYPDPKMFGLLFVILSFGLFPLGTIVSAYALVYIFVIYQSESSESESTIKLN